MPEAKPKYYVVPSRWLLADDDQVLQIAPARTYTVRTPELKAAYCNGFRRAVLEASPGTEVELTHADALNLAAGQRILDAHRHTQLKVIAEFVERATHWTEGGATRHDALMALKALGMGRPSINITFPAPCTGCAKLINNRCVAETQYSDFSCKTVDGV